MLMNIFLHSRFPHSWTLHVLPAFSTDVRQE
jgi:hypothetical protein